MEGLFIAFEGCEGCGKSSVSTVIAEKLKENNIPYILTREPGGTPISEKIRAVILDPSTPEMEPRTEALLYAASRTQHTLEKIIPALNEDKIVLCDRYIGSSFAYQGYARELGIEEIAEINDFGINGMRPDVTFFLDIEPEKCFQRIIKKRQLDRLEQEEMQFHNKVYEWMNKHSLFDKTWITINAEQPLEDVINLTWRYIIDIMG